MIAVTDHNACENGIYARQVAAGDPVVLIGMEIQSQEEVELLALFQDEGACLSLQNELYEQLPDVECVPELFGDQVVVDGTDNIVRHVRRLLLSPVPWTLSEVVERVEERGGWALPSHVDRVPGGLLGVLGLLPEGRWPDALELSPWTPADAFLELWPALRGIPLFRSSDAHFPEEIGRGWSELTVRERTLAELRAAVEGVGGRRVVPSPHS